MKTRIRYFDQGDNKFTSHPLLSTTLNTMLTVELYPQILVGIIVNSENEAVSTLSAKDVITLKTKVKKELISLGVSFSKELRKNKVVNLSNVA